MITNEVNNVSAAVAEETAVALMKNTDPSRSWFCDLGNLQKQGFEGNPEVITEQIASKWLNGNINRSCAVAYCLSADGEVSYHAVFSDTKTIRHSAVQGVYPDVTIKFTKGVKDHAEDFINRRGEWESEGTEVCYIARRGEVSGRQGARSDLESIGELIEQGLTPREILDMDISHYRYETIIRKAYYRKRDLETPDEREIKVVWHVGESGTGKSRIHVELRNEYGQDRVYYAGEYKNGFDSYNGEPILFMDEFKGQIKYALLLRILDKYKTQIAARYTNSHALWSEVHIASVFPPEVAYKEMVKAELQNDDSYMQLHRRITQIDYHFIKYGEYLLHSIPISEYVDYDHF